MTRFFTAFIIGYGSAVILQLAGVEQGWLRILIVTAVGIPAWKAYWLWKGKDDEDSQAS